MGETQVRRRPHYCENVGECPLRLLPPNSQHTIGSGRQVGGNFGDIDDADRSESFLETQPTLQLDTRHFDGAFTERFTGVI